MGCNCKATGKIDYLTRKYGENAPLSRMTNITGIMANTIKGVAIWVLMLLFFPLFLIVFLVKKIFFKKKEIRISKYIKIKI